MSSHPNLNALAPSTSGCGLKLEPPSGSAGWPETDQGPTGKPTTVGTPSLRRIASLLPWTLVFAGALSVPTNAGILDWLFPKHDIQVITVTDTTPVGALRRTVSPANPVYYIAVSAGSRDFGGIMAGEKMPPKEAVYQTMGRVMGKQGYLPATDQNPATLLLLWTWGTMNTDRMYTGDPDDLDGRQVNQRQLMRFMGAYKLGLISKEPNSFASDTMMQGVLFRDADQDLIHDLSTEDLYVVAIAAYDFGAATRKEKVLLWTTKISCPSRGLSMQIGRASCRERVWRYV